ncbi:hypothetical protein GN958_ATG04304 [Phytophthora infestans]|uniref:Uncharacterized protein n=1 Tax=Phytophthora infestans TaxID=4787 RepID=A0A8S9V149_PHYIN|nr:hypothetical protein GN958_ATG04304 [Phytophthora infestans]
MILTLVLNLRTKNIASKIAAKRGEATSHSGNHLEDLVVAARSKLFKAHYDVPVAETPAPRSSQPFLFGAPVPSPSKQRFQDNQVLEKAEDVAHKWMELDVDWVQVSLQHFLTPETKESKMKTPEQVRLERKKLLTQSTASKPYGTFLSCTGRLIFYAAFDKPAKTIFHQLLY